MAKKGTDRGQGRARRVIAGLAAMSAFLAALAFVGPLLVPSSTLAPRAAEALAAATGAAVTVDAAHLTLMGGPGLALHGVHLGLAPESATLLEDASASLALWPLLRREVVVDHLKACGPSLRATWRGQPLELGTYELDAAGLNFVVARLGAAPPPAVAAEPRLPADLAGRFRLKAGRGAWSTLSLEDVALDAQLDGRVITVHSFAAECGDGRVELSGRLDFAGPAPVLSDGRAGLRGVRAGALVGPWAPAVAAQLEVRLSGTVTAAGTFASPGALASSGPLASLVAEAHLGLAEGLVRAGPWLGEAAPYLGDRQDLVDIRIDAGRLAARLDGGKCLVDTLTTTGPDTDWEVAGAIGLADPAVTDRRLDLAVHVRLPAGFTPVLGALTFFAEALRDADRRVNLDLRVQGTLEEALVNLDLAAMSARARRS